MSSLFLYAVNVMDDRVLQIVLRARDEASAKLRSFQSTADKLGESMTSMGSKMALLGAAPTAGIILATKASIDFESSFAGVRKTVDASEAEFRQLANNFRNISKTTPVAVNDLNKIGELAGQLGVRGVDNLTKFTKTIADISVTTNLTTESASTAFARIFNIMGVSMDKVDKMGSAVVDLGNNFATTEAEIVEFANRIAGAGKIAGLSVNDILAIGTAMSSVGVQAEAGGTAVQKVLLAMTDAVKGSGAGLQTFAKTAGVTATEFKQMFEDEASGAFIAFVNGLSEQGDEAMKTLDDLGMSDQRLVRSFLSLANAGDLVNKTFKVSGKAWSDNIALAEEAEKRYETTASQIQIFKNNLYDLGIVIGGAILPAINNMVKAVSPAIKVFSDFASKHPQVVTAVLLIGAGIGALGLVFMVLGGVISGIAATFSAFGLIAGAVGAVIGAISLPVLLVVGAIAALIAIGYLLWQNWDMIKLKAQEVWTTVTTYFSIFVAWLQAGITSISTAIVNFFTVTIPSALSTAGGAFAQMVSNVIAILPDLFLVKIPYWIGFLHAFITVAIPNMIKVFIDWWGQLPFKIHEFMMQVQTHIITILTTVITWLATVIPQLVTNVGNWLSQIPPVVNRIFTQAKIFLMTIVLQAIAWLLAKLIILPSQINNAIASIPTIVSNVFEQTKAWALEKMGQLYEGVMGWWNKIKEIFSNIKNAIGDALGTMGKAFTAGRQAGMSFASGGFVPRTGMALVHQGEYVLSRDMLAGRKPIHAGVGVGSGGQTFNIVANVQDISDVDSLAERLAFRMKTAGNL